MYSDLEVIDNAIDGVIDFNKIDSPALKNIIKEFQEGYTPEMAYDRTHKDWADQGQCGCVMGCVLG
jgi:hypothetical protein